MKTRVAVWLILCISICASKVNAQWPMDLTSPKGAFITIYQPQLESFEGNKLKGRAAFSVKEKSTDEPLFGVIWFTASMETDRDTRMASLVSIIIDNIKLPDVTDESKISKLKALLEEEIPKWELTASMEEITASIENEQQTSGTEELKNDPPKIIYKEQATTLIFIDGEPKIEKDDKLNMNRVINTAFLIVQNPDDKKYYLYGGTYWYVSGQVKEGWAAATNLPKTISSLDSQIKKQEKESGKKPAEKPANPPALVVSTVPSELIQSDGKASFANIDGTNLLYVSNSEDNIFKSVDDQAYYVLISGRWYSSPALDGSWKYISADKLPADFAKIPVGSEKDNVLSSVPGTDAAKDAVMDAQIPQTAKVDRQKATCTVEYNGEPKFEKIDGTSLELAMNTSSTVLRSGKKYYCVENGVWFVADNAKGPWKVSDERPEDVEDIPASSSAYNTKYVYVYESTPEVVYVGYTPGYMGCYVYGPTVVYGTGYYYSPWYGPYYYPRPVTYGFSMHYNPWCGWSMGFHFSVGFFSFHSYGYGGYGGYWGPPMYRPPYYPPYHGGMYGGRGPTYINNDIDINIDNSNNIYNRRNDVSTRDISRGDRQGSRPTAGQQPTSRPGASTQPSNRPTTGQQPSNRPGASTQPSTGKTKPSTQPRPSTTPTTKQTPSASTSQNNVYADRNGNVYQRNDNGSWDQRSNNQWQSSSNNMNSSYQSRERSTQANRSYSQMQGGGNMGGASRPSTSSRPSGGGMRGGGGRRG